MKSKSNKRDPREICPECGVFHELDVPHRIPPYKPACQGGPSDAFDINFSTSAYSSRIRVLGPRVLLQRLELPSTSQGGLYVLGREFPTIALVLAVGTGWRLKRKRSLCGGLIVGNICSRCERVQTHGDFCERALLSASAINVSGLGDASDHELEQASINALYDVDARIQLDVRVGDKVTYDRFAWEKFQLPKAPNLAIMPYEELQLCIEED